MVLDVLHPNRPNVSKAELGEKLAKEYKTDAKNVVLFGFRTDFGGQKSTGFALVYDSLKDLIDAEPKYRLVRAGLAPKKEGSRKQRRELKNKKKTVRGKAKAAAGAGKAGEKKKKKAK